MEGKSLMGVLVKQPPVLYTFIRGIELFLAITKMVKVYLQLYHLNTSAVGNLRTNPKLIHTAVCIYF